MPKDSVYADVANATVSILGKVGQGVLVNKELIITAAHCIDYSLAGGMVLGDHFLEPIKARGRELVVRPLVVEPVKDIAVLGPLDDQTFSKEVDDYERFCEDTNPVPLCRRDYAFREKFTVYIYTHKGTWVTGTAEKYEAHLSVVADEQIESGTSGGPIINDSGDLVGVVSNFTEVGEGLPKSTGSVPYPRLALPVWVCRRIFGGN